MCGDVELAIQSDLDRVYGRGGRWLAATFLSALALVPTAGIAATPAGTIITNIADIRYQMDGITRAAKSNRVDVRVDELIKFTVTPVPSCATPQGVTAIGFRITNLGNGFEDFVPARPEVVEGRNFVISGVYADTNGNGCYDPGIDQLIPPGGHTPRIGPGGSTIIFVVGTGGTGPIRVRILVYPGTGSGGVGDNGGTVVTGGGSGGVTGDSSGTTTSTPLSATLVKSQTVLASDGSATPRAGATVTYTIEGRFAGSGTATGAVIADAIPAGTNYIPGSLTLDGATVSDTGGDDAGDFDGQRVSVRLGDIASPTVRTIAFKVRIK